MFDGWIKLLFSAYCSFCLWKKEANGQKKNLALFSRNFSNDQWSFSNAYPTVLPWILNVFSTYIVSCALAM